MTSSECKTATPRARGQRVLHVVGLPHTVVDERFSHCAFTGKIYRFAKMMQARGWHVVEYSNGASTSEAAEKVQVLSEDHLMKLSKRAGENEDYQADLHNKTLVDVFTRQACQHLSARVADGDIVCHVFGQSPLLVEAAPRCFHVESGVGYTCTSPALYYRVYESSAWMHWHYGRRSLEWGKNYEFVAPNYYDLADWPVVGAPAPPEGPYVIFFGRITESKGMRTIAAIALQMPETTFLLVGHGDPTPWTSLAKNIKARPAVMGLGRGPLLGHASALIAPSCFIEPFCGAAVEAQLCGTPVVTSAFGAFWETVEDGVTGYRCNSLADYVGALRRAPKLDRAEVAKRARRLYSLETVGAQYDRIFRNIADQGVSGWYGHTSHKFGSKELSDPPGE